MLFRSLSMEPDQVELSTSAMLAEISTKQLVEELFNRIGNETQEGHDETEDDDDEDDDF